MNQDKEAYERAALIALSRSKSRSHLQNDS
ncbi:hypothetical protein ACVWZW_003552 [Bradyrhizobium sp. F1.13.4]